MSLIESLLKRANHACELCKSTIGLTAFEVVGGDGKGVDMSIVVCDTCSSQLKGEVDLQVSHWRCLNDSMWSEIPAVQVVAYRMLSQLRKEGWPQDLLDMLYLPEGVLEWAKDGQLDEETATDDAVKHVDSNGVELQSGDSIVLIKDLKVKGASFVAKRGTAVRNISLVHDNPLHIEGKVNGQQIVILTQYVKK